ncbi:short-chain dehydrogenase [Sporocytophaga myxococcoides]|uniref:Short-chain dehydrogenase n=1 Tax=Sporocytophaga myxococcoides TaxID=153721 RepID=A0A098L8J7_9BACT|nr:SDR family oxidoreductase [Sporocytophaga myxococcoides]GAL83130.1 short-chain dehydrogenase [Sporocytophaga myxococcoides]
MGRLENKIAIVTGAGTGIGEAIAKRFAQEGAKVVVCGFPEDPVDDTVKSIKEEGGDAVVFKGDISEEANARACIQTAIDHFGKLDILINNAGVFPEINELTDYSNEAFSYLVKNNIESVFMMTKYALPELQKSKGNIVSAGSEAGKIGIADNTPYGGTKAFIHSFMRGVAIEQARYGVRANCVCPGPIDTSWLNTNESQATDEMVETFVNATAIGRKGTPEEIANVYLFLASDEASYVTGALYSVDGGVTITKGGVGVKADKSMKKEPKGHIKLQHQQEGATYIREPAGKR